MSVSIEKKFSDSASTEELHDFILEEDGLLSFHPESLLKPGNWSFKKKINHTVLYGLVTFCAQFTSTALSSSRFDELMQEQFDASREVSILAASSLYILGIAFGPMVFAPISEVYGRKIGVLIPFLLSSVFAFACATSYNMPSLLVYRFLSGFFCGAPIVSAGGVLADIYPDPSIRGKYFATYAMFVSLGPAIGPIISSLLMYSKPNNASAWRIPEYFCGLMNLTLFLICEFVLEETFMPTVLQEKARQLRLDTSNYQIHCSHDTWSLEFKVIVSKHLVRPFKMLFTPIVFVIVLFASYVYGVFYIFITTIPEAMYLSRGWTGTTASLPNLCLFFGTVAGCVVNMLYAKKFARTILANGGVVIPEERFPLVIHYGWLMPGGIFIFSWSSSEDIHWIVQCIGIFCMSMGFITIFQGCLNYLVDTYTSFAASAIAANTFLRSIFAAGFPLFSKQMFHNLGVHWGGSIIGFIALGMIPIPFVFKRYGASIRARKPYTG